MKRILLTAALAAAVAGPAFSQDDTSANPLAFASDYQTIPTMANVPGQQGAVFSSHVSIMNPTSAAFAVNVSFYDAAGTKKDATISLAPGELKVYENFLDAVFHVNTAGAATFSAPEASGGGHNNRFILSTEVWTTGAAGRFGTTVPVLEFAGTAARSFAAGVTIDATTRTNVGCFNQSSATNAVKATVFDGSGKSVSTINLSLPPNAWGQTGATGSVSGGYVVFEPSDAAVCWAVVVSNSSNDGRFISAAEYTP